MSLDLRAVGEGAEKDGVFAVIQDRDYRGLNRLGTWEVAGTGLRVYFEGRPGRMEVGFKK